MTHEPTSEDELRRQAHRGERAKALLENPLLVEAFERVEQTCVDLWKASKSPEDREALWKSLQATQNVRTAIEAVVKDGDLSARKLKHAIEGKKSVF